MRFDTIPYMEWAKTRIDPSDRSLADMSSSGMAPLIESLVDIGIDPADIPLSGDNAYGYRPLREQLAARYGVQPENVLPANGTSMANFLLYTVLLNPGDVVLMETPVYECLSRPPAAMGARVVPFERREDQNWKLPVDEIASLAYAIGAAGVVLTNPHNPSGAFTSDEEILRLAEGVGKDRFVLVDEVYREWLPDQEGRTVALRRPNLYTTSSLTKVWGFGSLRAGWALAPHHVVKAAMRAYDHMGVIDPFPTDWIAWRLFSDGKALHELRDRSMRRIKEARAMVDRFLKSKRGRALEGWMPPAGGYGFLNVKGVSGDLLSRELYDDHRVIVTPGRFFGSSGHIRIAWTRGVENVRRGLEGFENWLGGR